MQIREYQRVIDELQSLIEEAKALITRAEAFYGEMTLPRDYDSTYEIYSWAITMQKQYTLDMLNIGNNNSA